MLATTDVDAIVSHALIEDRAAAVGAARRIPVLPVYFFPLVPSSTFASPFITTRNLGPLNRLIHELLLDMLWKSSRRDVDELRASLGLHPARRSFTRAVQERGASDGIERGWTGSPLDLLASNTSRTSRGAFRASRGRRRAGARRRCRARGDARVRGTPTATRP